MKSPIITYPIYDLSNPHFQNVEILTTKGEILKGQFVRFSVVELDVEYLYPSEKYCFLPEEKQKQFKESYEMCNGKFKKFPPYIWLFGLNDMASIKITPTMVY